MEDLMHKPEGYEWTMEDLYAAGHGNIGLTPIKGPNDIQDRYLTEDVPFGHVAFAAIADMLGVEMPLTNALISIILGGEADDATLIRADVNEDGEINIADVNALIDIILQ